MKPAALALLALLFSVSAVHAQAPLTCTLFDIAPAQRTLRITCRALLPLPQQKVTLQFIDQFAGVAQLSERVRGVQIKDERGAQLLPELRGNGFYAVTTAAGKEVALSYTVNLARAFDPAQHALVSSLGPEAAVLMLGDLLPRVCAGTAECAAGSARLKIEAPPGWEVTLLARAQGEEFEIDDLRQAVVFLAHFRQRTVAVDAMKIKTALAGAWSFADNDAFALAESIARKQAEMIGGHESGEFLVIIAPFPQPLTGLRSSGITLGRTVVLLVNLDADAGRTLAHFQKHLAHELFHFYLPNAFAIGENFDWFWEGFTRYIALVTLVELRALTFRQYLDALAAEHTAYAFNPLRARISLRAASPEKFADAASYELVYRKGMLVAALYDLELRWQSEGRANVTTVMGALYQHHAHTRRAIGNQEVLEELARGGQGARFLRDDVEGTKQIELDARLKPYGLMIEQLARGPARIVALPKLSARQRRLLTSLGG